MSVGGERDLRVRIGSMISPDHFWLIPYRKSEQLVQLERELAECFSSSSSFGQGMVPSVEEVVPEAIVALTVDFKVWKRAKVVTKIARFLSGSQAKFLLLDYGQTTDYCPIQNLRVLPKSFLSRLKPQAKEIKIPGLIPITRTLRLDLLLHQDHLRGKPCKDWSASARKFVSALVAMSESAVIELGYSDLLIKLGASSECPVTDLGDKSLAGMLVPGSVVSLKDLLVETEHAIVEEDPEEYDLAMRTLSRPKPLQHLHTLHRPPSSVWPEDQPNRWSNLDEEGFSTAENWIIPADGYRNEDLDETFGGKYKLARESLAAEKLRNFKVRLERLSRHCRSE